MKKIGLIILTILLAFTFVDKVDALEMGIFDNNLVLDSYEKILCCDTNIPYIAAQITRIIIIVLQIATPIIIILFGMMDLIKAVVAQKEDEIKKGQQTFLRRTIVGVCVFLVFVGVQFVIGLVAPQRENPNMWNCVDCFVNGDCASVKQ